MNDIQIFNFNQQQVRTVIINEMLWWVAKDVCDILGISNVSASLKYLDESDKGYTKIYTPGGEQQLLIVNEPGLYTLTFRSNKVKAKEVKNWIVNDVMPSIRKTGAYIPIQLGSDLPDINSDFVYQLAEAMKAKEAEIQALKPKAEFFDTVASSKSAIQIGDVAKMLGIPGIGRNNLFEILRAEKVLMKDNMPYQTYCDRGYFRVVEQKYSVEGEIRISMKTLVFQKGVSFIREILQAREHRLLQSVNNKVTNALESIVE